MRVISLGSGSNGNAFIVESGSTRILVDAGIPIRQLRATLGAVDIAFDQLSAVILTHEHADHIRSLPQVARGCSTPFFATRGTINRVSDNGVVIDWQSVTTGVAFDVGSIRVTPVSISHDASEPVGYTLEEPGCRVAIVTDLGEATSDIEMVLRDARLVVIESNYDDQLLARGPYPAHLKRRIRGPLGHLSNGDCAALLERSLSSVTTEVWLAHLSETNNRPEVALSATIQRLGIGPRAPEVTPLPRYGRGRSVVWDDQVARTIPRQMALF